MRPWAVLLIVYAMACAPKVRLEVPASPAVQLPTQAVAVIARDRECQATANALVRRLSNDDSLQVDPRADVRLELFACGDDQEWTLEQQATSEETRIRRRTVVAARAHAVMAVTHHDRVLAHLIGAGRDHNDSAWHEGSTVVGVRNTARQDATEDLVHDLARQIDPLPTLAARRVYPNAPEGTAKALTTMAVQAEQSGEIEEALRLALASWDQDPTPRTAAYLVELRRRVATR